MRTPRLLNVIIHNASKFGLNKSILESHTWHSYKKEITKPGYISYKCNKCNFFIMLCLNDRQKLTVFVYPKARNYYCDELAMNEALE